MGIPVTPCRRNLESNNVACRFAGSTSLWWIKYELQKEIDCLFCDAYQSWQQKKSLGNCHWFLTSFTLLFCDSDSADSRMSWNSYSYTLYLPIEPLVWQRWQKGVCSISLLSGPRKYFGPGTRFSTLFYSNESSIATQKQKQHNSLPVHEKISLLAGLSAGYSSSRC